MATCLILLSGLRWPHKMNYEVFFPLYILYILNILENLPVKPSGSGLCLLRGFDY